MTLLALLRSETVPNCLNQSTLHLVDFLQSTPFDSGTFRHRFKKEKKPLRFRPFAKTDCGGRYYNFHFSSSFRSIGQPRKSKLLQLLRFFRFFF
jgi:hypothetical protein